MADLNSMMGGASSSVHMRALVAIALPALRHEAVILSVWPPIPEDETTSLSSSVNPWEAEYEAVGSYRPVDLGLQTPKEAGFWMWEGKLYYPGPDCEGVYDSGPEWRSAWRKATEEEVLDFLRHKNSGGT